MRAAKRIAVTTALMLAAASSFPSLLRADDVLEKVPDNALFAVKVANLRQTSNKVAQFAQDFGIVGFVPQLGDPLGALKQRTGITKGLNEAGEIAIAMISPKSSNLPEDKSLVMLVPVTHYNDFVGNFADAQTTAGVSEATFPGDNEPTFIADWGNYAALSPVKELLAKPTGTIKPAGLTKAESAKHDFVIYANFAQITPDTKAQIDKAFEQGIAHIDAPESKIEEKYRPLAKVLIGQLNKAANTYMAETEAATVGISIVDAGINTTVVNQFKADTYLAKAAASVKNTDAPLLTGLPALPFLVYGGLAAQPEVTTQLIDDIGAPLFAELSKVPGQADTVKLINDYRTILKSVNGATFAMPVPAALGDEGIIQQVQIYRGGGAALKKSITDSTELLKIMMSATSGVEGIQTTLEAAPASKTIDGVSLDQLTLKMTGGEGPEAAQHQQMMGMMYGPDGIKYQYGIIGKDDLIFSTGDASDETLSAFIKASNEAKDNFSGVDHIKATLDQLPKSRVMMYMIALDEVFNLGIAAANQFGMPIQVQLPPARPPLGITVGAEGSTLRIDSHIPSTTLQSLMAAGMQIFMQLQQNNGGGGNL
jgi:hypothetical protein